MLKALIHFGDVLGADALSRWAPKVSAAAVAAFAEGVPGAEAQP